MGNFDINFGRSLQTSFDLKFNSMKSLTFLLIQAYKCLYVKIYYFSGVFK